MQRSMGNLLAPPPKEFVSDDLDDEDEPMDEDDNGLVQLHCTTWTKLLITLFIVALIMSIGDAALQLGCFVALPWLCVIFVSVIYFDSKHVHESLVPRVLKIVGDENVDDVKIPRCPHCGLRVKHDDESQCPKQDKVCWLLRAEEPYLMNEKKYIAEISKFAPKANGYFGLSGLDVLRYLLLVVCLNVSSGICVVWWWAFDNTGTEEDRSLGDAEVIVGILFCFLATIVFVKILSTVLYHFVFAASVRDVRAHVSVYDVASRQCAREFQHYYSVILLVLLTHIVSTRSIIGSTKLERETGTTRTHSR